MSSSLLHSPLAATLGIVTLLIWLLVIVGAVRGRRMPFRVEVSRHGALMPSSA